MFLNLKCFVKNRDKVKNSEEEGSTFKKKKKKTTKLKMHRSEMVKEKI
jgi:hypothetical protein